MTATSENPPVTQFEHNRMVLHNGELGEIAEAAYLAAVELDPRLEAAEVIAETHRRLSFARAIPAWASMESPRHRLIIPTGDVKPRLHYLVQDIKAIPGAMEHYAEKMGVRGEDITPEGLYVFVELHELGHISDYMDHEHRQREFVERERAEKLALPIADVSVSTLMSPASRQNFQLKKHWDQIAVEQGVSSIEAMYAKQYKAYYSMTAEVAADNFAATVLAAYPELVPPPSSE